MTTLADVVVSDPVEMTGNPDAARTALREAVDAAKSDDKATDDTTKVDSTASDKDKTAELPEKFRGKSVKDVVDMYQNLESRLGTMANDLGVQRQLTDRLLDLKRDADLRRNSPPEERPAPITTDDLLSKPQETLERVIEARVKRVTEDVNQRLTRAEAALAQTTFLGRHKDYAEVVNEQGFKDWVQASPIRLRAAAAAHQGNWQIADELLTEYKGAKAKPETTGDATASKADLEAARRAALDTSGTAGGADGKSGGGAKTYRRADLMRLRISDPEAYYDEDFQNEILKAHSEGRVK